MIGTMALGLIASPAFVASARHVAHAVQQIEHTSNSLSTVERVVFGLILSDNQAPQPVQAPRT